MTPAEFRSIIAALGMSQQEVARLLGLAGRTPQRWVAGEQDIPRAAALALLLMERHGVTVEQAKALLAE